MRIVGIILTIFIAFSAATSAHVDVCAVSKICKSQDCVDSDNSKSADSLSQSPDDSSHSHCNVHCFHQCFYYQSQGLVVFDFAEISGVQSYQFAYTQAFLDGPFRPPLV